MGNLIKVCCLVVPTGDTLWFENKNMKEIIEAWKEQNPEFSGTKCSIGAVVITMPKEKYNQIPATNRFIWP